MIVRDHAQIGAHCALWAGAEATIEIGEGAVLAPDVFITVTNYGTLSGRSIFEQPRTEAGVMIGAGAWLGARVIVLPGVDIGAGCVVGAGTVVTQSLPAGSLAIGNPARVVGTRAAGDPG